jgi:hypothetical protein
VLGDVLGEVLGEGLGTVVGAVVGLVLAEVLGEVLLAADGTDISRTREGHAIIVPVYSYGNGAPLKESCYDIQSVEKGFM